jgi:hypothetical protein
MKEQYIEILIHRGRERGREGERGERGRERFIYDCLEL